MTKKVAEAGAKRPLSLDDILIDGLGFDWKDTSAFHAALRDSKDPRAFMGAVWEIERVIHPEMWVPGALGPGEIAARLDVILAALRDLRNGLKELDPEAVEGWSRAAWGTSRDAIRNALRALTIDAGMDDAPCLVWRSYDDLDEAEPQFAALQEAARAAAVWGPGGGSPPKRRLSRSLRPANRPANRDAYQIAGIVAGLFRNFGRAPTYGTGTSPFKRTLQAVFTCVGIEASADGPGKWARKRGRKSAK